MTKLQEFIDRHAISAAAIPALCAVLDARLNGDPLEPRLAASIRELFETLGAGELLDNVAEQEAGAALGMLRAMYLVDGKLLFAATRTGTWSHDEAHVLQAFGEAARAPAHALTQFIVPACAGLAERLRTRDGTLLDVGVGVAGTAIAVARMWPELRIVGLDTWQPALRLARANVDNAGLNDRIELREQGVEALTDRDAFDLAWFALQFIPERFVRPGLERVRRALRPGGWIVSGAAPEQGSSPQFLALLRLRYTQWGGPVWNGAQLEEAFRTAGFVDVRALPRAPEAPVTFVIGRVPT